MVHSHLQLDFWQTILMPFWIIRQVWARHRLWGLCWMSYCTKTRLCMAEAVQTEFGFVSQRGLNYQAKSEVTFVGLEEVA